MAIPFSDTSGNTGILQQARAMAGVDANQWPTVRVSNSSNHWLNFLTGLALKYDKRFRWDNTTHTDLPESTQTLNSGQADYSFDTDQLGNSIITLLNVYRLQDSTYVPLEAMEETEVDMATWGTESGIPSAYVKIADNIIRLDKKTTSTTSAGLKLRFQRTSPYYTASDTTKKSGFSPLLDRGFVVASAYDAALSLGLPTLQGLALERQNEVQNAKTYFESRNEDTIASFGPEPILYE